MKNITEKVVMPQKKSDMMCHSVKIKAMFLLSFFERTKNIMVK